MKVEDIAKVAHEANRALTSIIKDVEVQPAWEFITDDMRASCLRGVAFALMNPDATPEKLHEKWCQDKLANGWQYGETRSEAAKLHPAIRPYEDLPLAQRKKDALFRAIVTALMPNEAIMKEALEAAQAGEGSVEEDDSSEAGELGESRAEGRIIAR